MKNTEVMEELKQQLRAVVLEKQKTIDSLKIVAEPKKRKRVHELWQLQNQQQDDLHRMYHLSPKQVGKILHKSPNSRAVLLKRAREKKNVR